MHFGDYNVLVLERFCVADDRWVKTFADYVTSAGKTLIWDGDDDFAAIEDYNPASEVITKEVAVHTAKLIASCHAVTASTEYLASRLRRHNPNVYVLPNCLDLEMWDQVARVVPVPDHLTIGWFGSVSHVRDIEILESVWPEVARRCPNVSFIAAGYCSPALQQSLGNRLEVLGWAPLRDYPAIVRRIRIGCLPLLDIEFNRSKSNLKFLEFAALGIPCVASPCGPYRNLSGESEVLHAVTASQWTRQLLRLVKDVELRKRIGACAQRVVREKHDMRMEAEQWFHTYRTIRLAQPNVADHRPMGVWV